MQTAAAYYRSSKDRHDISIDVQQRALRQLAEQLNLTLVQEFRDVVESGKDEDRPDFQRLIQAVRDPRRGWSTLLVFDTSRLVRGRVLAVLFEELEAARHGVRVVYRSLPENMDPGTEVVLKSAMQAMDEWHSITSRQKGLAGMAQNVRAGYRAGGRAPLGYRLVKEGTGAVRDGMPVLKSKLEPDDNAPRLAQYLAARAAGTRRAVAARDAGLTCNKSSLVGIEWNALTYAGHTVWNVHASRKGGAAVGGHRRRPRSEWQIQRDTHKALITDAQAEAILKRLADYSATRARRTSGKYLLTGMLRTPDGARWYGESSADAYRTKGRYVPRETLEKGIMGKVMEDLSAPAFITALLEAAEAAQRGDEGARHGRALHSRLGELTTRISRMMDMAADLADAGPALRKIDELEAERKRCADALEQWQREQAQCAAQSLDANTIRRALKAAAADLKENERDSAKAALESMVDKVVLDPATLDCAIHYRVRPTQVTGLLGRNKAAYPWGRHLNPYEPVIRLVMPLALKLARTPTRTGIIENG